MAVSCSRFVRRSQQGQSEGQPEGGNALFISFRLWLNTLASLLAEKTNNQRMTPLSYSYTIIMNGQEFLRVCTAAFAPFLRELGFLMDSPSISGRFYRVNFTAAAHAVSVSYEPGDEALFVIVFGRENGELTDIDDRLKTPRLADLNARYMPNITSEERAANEAVFASVETRGKEESTLLKTAKELRLVLPKYLRR